MNQRETKFRAWDKINKKMDYNPKFFVPDMMTKPKGELYFLNNFFYLCS